MNNYTVTFLLPLLLLFCRSPLNCCLIDSFLDPILIMECLELPCLHTNRNWSSQHPLSMSVSLNWANAFLISQLPRWLLIAVVYQVLAISTWDEDLSGVLSGVFYQLLLTLWWQLWFTTAHPFVNSCRLWHDYLVGSRIADQVHSSINWKITYNITYGYNNL